ncbi:hypothetical protein M9434_004492 [Picochlorum sp. BPE23]|nr:hypothetical protein M9435_002583 [Picochlorum sp. BPE23]KAI8110918.1 hypothetical protein M9434_004492 [Picochlorum sp. BPE23]
MGNALCFRQSISTADQAVLDLKSLKKKLDSISRALESKIVDGRAVVKELVAQGKSKRAKLVLKQVVLEEKMLCRCEQQVFQVESMLLHLSEQQTVGHVVDALKDGNAAMKELQKIVTVTEIGILMEDTKEAREKQQQIEACLAQIQLNSDLVVSEADLELEQKAIDAEDNNKLNDGYPEVPTSIPNGATEKKKHLPVLVGA